MKLAAITAALALAGSTLAAPYPQTNTTLAAQAAPAAAAAPAPRTNIQNQIQTLEIQIVNVINDIVQSSSTLSSNYETGTNQFAALTQKLQGPQPCGVFTPGKPSSKKRAVASLNSAQQSLMQLSLDLQNPANKIPAGDFHADVCTAWGYYGAVQYYIRA